MHNNNINNQSVKKWRCFTHRNIFTISIWIIRKLGDFSCLSPSKELFLILIIHCNLHLYCRFKFLSTHLSSKEQFHFEKVHKNSLFFFYMDTVFLPVFIFEVFFSWIVSNSIVNHINKELVHVQHTVNLVHTSIFCAITQSSFRKICGLHTQLPTQERFQDFFGGFHKLCFKCLTNQFAWAFYCLTIHYYIYFVNKIKMVHKPSIALVNLEHLL